MGIGETWLSTRCKKCGAQQYMSHYYLGNGPAPILCSDPKCNTSNLPPLGSLKWKEEEPSPMKEVVSKMVGESMRQQNNLVAAYLHQNPHVRVEDLVLIQKATDTGIEFSIKHKLEMAA